MHLEVWPKIKKKHETYVIHQSMLRVYHHDTDVLSITCHVINRCDPIVSSIYLVVSTPMSRTQCHARTITCSTERDMGLGITDYQHIQGSVTCHC